MKSRHVRLGIIAVMIVFMINDGSQKLSYVQNCGETDKVRPQCPEVSMYCTMQTYFILNLCFWR